MQFTDEELAVLDLAAESDWALGHIAHLGGHKPRPADALALVGSMVKRGLVELYEIDAVASPTLSVSEVEDILSRLNEMPFQTDDWWRYGVVTTEAGDAAYRTAYGERR